jgi:hypothetical protein
MNDKIFITLTTVTPKTAILESWGFTDTSSLSDAEKLQVFLEFIEQFKKSHKL